MSDENFPLPSQHQWNLARSVHVKNLKIDVKAYCRKDDLTWVLFWKLRGQLSGMWFANLITDEEYYELNGIFTKKIHEPLE